MGRLACCQGGCSVGVCVSGRLTQRGQGTGDVASMMLMIVCMHATAPPHACMVVKACIGPAVSILKAFHGERQPWERVGRLWHPVIRLSEKAIDGAAGLKVQVCRSCPCWLDMGEAERAGEKFVTSMKAESCDHLDTLRAPPATLNKQWLTWQPHITTGHILEYDRVLTRSHSGRACQGAPVHAHAVSVPGPVRDTSLSVLPDIV